jgi:predicted amidophosphoribosyltransferase
MPQGCPPVWASGPYAGPFRGALVAFKDGDRRDLVHVLAPLLAAALQAALAEDVVVAAALQAGRPVWLVPAPSSPQAVRSRGDVPLNILLGKAIREIQVRGSSPFDHRSIYVARCLRLTRRVADQAGLDSVERAANLDRAMAVRARWAGCPGGSACVLVDDVLTTGATLTEAARALREAGAGHVVGATVAATQRRRGHPFG